MKDPACLLFSQSAFSIDPIKQLAVSAIFHEDIGLSLVADDFIDLGNVGVQYGTLQLCLLLN